MRRRSMGSSGAGILHPFILRLRSLDHNDDDNVKMRIGQAGYSEIMAIIMILLLITMMIIMVIIMMVMIIVIIVIIIMIMIIMH